MPPPRVEQELASSLYLLPWSRSGLCVMGKCSNSVWVSVLEINERTEGLTSMVGGRCHGHWWLLVPHGPVFLSSTSTNHEVRCPRTICMEILFHLTCYFEIAMPNTKINLIKTSIPASIESKSMEWESRSNQALWLTASPGRSQLWISLSVDE